MTVSGEVSVQEALSTSEIATAITMASEPFSFPLGEVGMNNFYISNDGGLGESYAALGELTPDAGDAQPISLYVGHAGFETATLYMPDGAIGLFCDRDPLTLAVQKAHIELIKRSSTIAELDEAEADFLHWLAYAMPIPVAKDYANGLRQQYAELYYGNYLSDRRDSWNDGRDDTAGFERHFLTDEEQFARVRARIEDTDFAFFLIDFNVDATLDGLSDLLKKHGCVITQANLTNMLANGYAGENSERILTALPWHPGAVCLTSHMDGYLKSVERVISELRIVHRNHQLKEAVFLADC